MKTRLLACTALVMAGAQPAFAQDGDEDVQEASGNTIVVTARARDESLQDVPVAVAVVTGEQLNQFGTTDVRDIANRVPGLVFEAQGGSGAGGSIALRGVSTPPTQAGFDQAVSVSVDGVQVGRPRILNLGLMDIAQVDVMRGPQTLFFGKNSPGGVIAIRSADPGNDLNGFLTGSYEFEADEVKLLGAIGGPLGDNLSVRLAGIYRNMEGWMINQARRPLTDAEITGATAQAAGRVPGAARAGSEEWGLRGTLVFDPSADFTADLRISYGEYNDDGPAREMEFTNCPGGATTVSSYGVTDPFADCVLDGRNSRTDTPASIIVDWPFARTDDYSEGDQLLVALNLDVALGDNLSITSTTGYYESNSAFSDSFDHTVFNSAIAAEAEQYEAFSQELRLISDFDGALNFVLGGYYQSTDLYFIHSSQIAPFGPDAVTGKFHNMERVNRADGETYSAFGQVIFDITDTIELAGGIRYSNETKDSSMTNQFAHSRFIPAGLAPPSVVLTNSLEVDDWSPEVTLTWRPTPDVSVFGSYKEGYKSGGMALSALLLSYRPATRPDLTEQEYIDQVYQPRFTFNPEFIEGFEAGVKSQWLDGMLTVNLSAFTYDYTDLQVSGFDADSFSFNITNAASASINGFELETNFRASDSLTLWGNLNYLDATFDNFIASCYFQQTAATGCVDPDGAGPLPLQNQRAGDPLPSAPEWSVNFGFDFEQEISNNAVFGLTGSARWSDRYYVGSDDGDPRSFQPSFWNIDLGARVVFDERYRLSVYGRNLTDELVLSRVTDAARTPNGTLSARVNRGRQFVVELGVDF